MIVVLWPGAVGGMGFISGRLMMMMMMMMMMTMMMMMMSADYDGHRMHLLM